jgi:hypothetical protein
MTDKSSPQDIAEQARRAYQSGDCRQAAAMCACLGDLPAAAEMKKTLFFHL